MVAPEIGLKLDEVGLEVLGRFRRVTVTKDDTTFVDGDGSENAIDDRIRLIEREIEDTDSDWDREKLQERLAKLAGGVARHPGRRGHRGRAQGAQAPHRGRHLGHPRGGRGGHRSPAAAPRLVHAATAIDGARPGPATSATGATIVRRALDEPLRQIAGTPASRARSWSRGCASSALGQGFDADRRRLRATSPSAASSTRSR